MGKSWCLRQAEYILENCEQRETAQTEKEEKKMEVHGSCDPKFQSVRQEFERNFRERGEVGASVCITLRGETVVDLWGGMARPESHTPWAADTISIVFSSTKGATA